MAKLSLHFSRTEFACKCGCKFDTVDAELLAVLVKLRDYFNTYVSINSGCRCLKYNKAVGGKSPTKYSVGSQHLYGRAADISVKGVPTEEVVNYLLRLYPYTLGIGAYRTFTHVDTRGGRARW